jgi:hypothetical protein
MGPQRFTEAYRGLAMQSTEAPLGRKVPLTAELSRCYVWSHLPLMERDGGGGSMRASGGNRFWGRWDGLAWHVENPRKDPPIIADHTDDTDDTAARPLPSIASNHRK